MPAISIMMKPASGLCNMHCSYCFYTDETSKREICSYGIMSMSTLEQILQKTLAFAEGNCSILFQGGEPTLAGLEFFKSVVELEHKWNVNHVDIQNSIQTNGLLIDEHWAKFFHDHNFLVGLSLDGTKEVHDACRKDSNQEGTFDSVLHTIELFKKYHVEFNILTVVTKHTILHTKEIYSFYKSMGFEWQQYIPCLNPLDGEAGFSPTAAEYGRFLCDTFDLWYDDFMSGRYVSVRQFDNYVSMLMGHPPESCGMSGVCANYFTVEGDGSVYPCDFYVLDEWKMGNINTDSIQDMAAGEAARRFVEVSRPVNEKCAACRWLPLCRGGCRRNREPIAENTLNQFCPAYEAFFDYAYEGLRRIAAAVQKGMA